MEFGFATIPNLPFHDNVRLIQAAESLGYAWAWVPDQTFYRDPYVMLTAAAAATRTIRLGIGITNPYTRHPAAAARAAASVDEASDGRLAFGLGAGNQKELIEPLGLTADAPARACRETMRLLRAFWAGRPVDQAGTEFSVRGAALEFPARPNIPIYIGGRGPQILHLGGQEADGLILSLSGLTYALELAQAGADSVGRDLGVVHKVAWGECAVLDGDVNLEDYRLRVAHVLGRAPEKGLKVMGLTDDEVAAIRRGFVQGGPAGAAQHVTDTMVQRHLVIGTAEECAARLHEFQSQGVHAYAYLIKETSFADKLRALEGFARQVMPRVAA
jgi:5,10-methylenetetrahydromethanopterin reductase